MLNVGLNDTSKIFNSTWFFNSKNFFIVLIKYIYIIRTHFIEMRNFYLLNSIIAKMYYYFLIINNKRTKIQLK